jgi:hypothetical protein
MRKLMLGAVLALALPAAAMAAQGTPSPEDLATTACKTEKSQMGTKTFKKTYVAKSTSKAMKACLAKQGVVAETELKPAPLAGPAAPPPDPVKFAEYGTNKNGKNAYGKCVSSKAKAASEANTEDRVAAAETCKAMTKEALQAEFGTKKNAFGKCVSTTAKESGEDE